MSTKAREAAARSKHLLLPDVPATGYITNVTLVTSTIVTTSIVSSSSDSEEELTLV